MRIKKNFFVFSFILIIIVPLWGIEGDVELLKFIADGYENSWEKVRTWGGSATIAFEDFNGKVEQTPSSGWRRHKQTEFLLDRDSKMTRWNARVEEVILDAGKEQQKSPFDYSGIIKPQQAYQMFYDIKNEKKIRTLEVLSPDGVIRTIGGFTFDPVYILQHEVYPDLPLMLRFYYENSHDPAIGECSVVRDGDIVKFEVSLPMEDTDQKTINRFVFDLSKGCNLLEFEALGVETDVRWQIDYERVDDVFIIKGLSNSYVCKVPGNESHSQMKALLVNKMVNKPVNPTEFEFDKIGLRPGDRILDRMVGELVYTWKDEYDTPEVVLDAGETTKAPLHQKISEPSLTIGTDSAIASASDNSDANKAPEVKPIATQRSTDRINSRYLFWWVLGLVLLLAIISCLVICGKLCCRKDGGQL